MIKKICTVFVFLIPILISTFFISQTVSASTCLDLNSNISIGSRDIHYNSSNVTDLQNFLVSQTLLKVAPTGYFWRLTEQAVKTFQTNNGIDNTGFVGPITRAKIKDITCNITQPQISTCKFIDLLANLQVISPEKASEVRTAMKCPAVITTCQFINFLVNLGVIEPYNANSVRSKVSCPLVYSGGGSSGGSSVPAATYTVTYNGNTNDTGSVPTDSNTYLSGTTVTVLSENTLIKSGYTFVGWNTLANGSGTSHSIDSTFEIGSANVILYAQWTALPTYTVTYDDNGSTSGATSTDSNNYLNGDSVLVLDQDTLLKTNYSFAGWATSTDGVVAYSPYSIFEIGSANVTLYAVWTQASTYTVTYNGNTNDTGSVPTDSNTYLSGTTVTVLSENTLIKSGYTFVGWNTLANGSGTSHSIDSTFEIGSANVILYAQWTALPTYTVTYDDNGSTSGATSTDSNNYLNGDMVTVLGNTGELEKTGSIFVGWNTTANGLGTHYNPGSTLTIASADITLFAEWGAPPTYTVIYNGNGSTGAPVDPNHYLPSSVVIVLGQGTLSTTTNYFFNNWNTSADCDGISYAISDTFAIGEDDVTLYACWAPPPTYTVIYDANGSTSGATSTDPNNYITGDTVTVLNNIGNLKKTGFVFAGWATSTDGVVAYVGGGTFSMGSENVTLYAVWTSTYTVTYNGNGNTAGSVPVDSSSPYLNGATVTVLDQGTLLKNYSSFTGWATSSSGVVAYASSTTFVIDSANVILYAQWLGDTHTVTFDANGGSGSMTPQVIADGSTANLTANSFTGPTATSTFSGWSTTPTGTISYADTENYTMGSSDVTLYAVWASFSGGTGTEIDPYQITNWTQLNNVRYFLSSYFILNNDISSTTSDYEGLGDDWVPIGSSSVSAFSGSFDGNDKTIGNLVIDNPTLDYVGLFGHVSGDVLDIGLIDVDITGKSFVGGLMGKSNGEQISNSYVTGDVSGQGFIGGLVGSINSNVTISNSYTIVDVTFSGSSSGGGLVGGSGGIISNSYSLGNITGLSNWVGGLVGYQSSGQISNSYATGDVTSSGSLCGGLVGNKLGSVSNSYATGDVSCNSYVGGLIGQSQTNLSNSYSTGRVTGTGIHIGGLIGSNTGTITNSFWDIQTSNQATSAGGTGTTTVAMKSLATFSNATWSISANVTDNLNSGYPYLSWQVGDTTPTWYVYEAPLVDACGTSGDVTDPDCWSTTSANELVWGPMGVLIGISESTAPNNGASNTLILVNLDGSYPAAEYCYNLTEDGMPAGTWYLPAINQLIAGLTAYRTQYNLGNTTWAGFTKNVVYWASNESTGSASLDQEDSAWFAWYNSNVDYVGDIFTQKDSDNYVRCLR